MLRRFSWIFGPGVVLIGKWLSLLKPARYVCLEVSVFLSGSFKPACALRLSSRACAGLSGHTFVLRAVFIVRFLCLGDLMYAMLNSRSSLGLPLSLLLLSVCLSGSVLTVVGCSPGSTAAAPAPAVAPQIATQPAAQSLFVGDTATFSVSATGTAPLSYQWARGGTSIAGANGASYTTATLVAADDGALYTVTVSNSAGSVTSSSGKLSVALHAPAITTNPSDVSVTMGSPATFTVAASGTGPLSYQWLRGGVVIGGATSSSYSLANAQLTDSGSLFSVVAANGAGTATSAAAKLTVTALPVSITVQPVGATQFVGETATFAVTVQGTSPTYQWRKNGAAIVGATATTYTTPALVAADDKETYDVVVSNTANSLASAAVTVRVGPFATSYTTQKGVNLSMFAWPGTKYAFLTKTAAYNPVTVRQILNAADGTWNYYATTVGQVPWTYFNYNGLATIADTGVGGVDLCGDGCTYIGATGMEISDRVTNSMLAGVPSTYDWVIFYETGRSFWVFQNQLEYKSPDTSACEVTGFAVFMGIHSIQAQNLPSDYGTNIPHNPNPFANELLALDYYTSNTSLNFQNTFLTSTFNSPYGDCPVLWTGLVYRLSLNYGGEAFIQALFKEALKRPAAVTTQDAIDNFVLAASAAAGVNLTDVFQTKYKWPVSTAAATEARNRFGLPV